MDGLVSMVLPGGVSVKHKSDNLMKVKLIKDHLEHKKGKELDVTKERAKYFELVGVAKPVKKTVQKPKPVNNKKKK